MLRTVTPLATLVVLATLVAGCGSGSDSGGSSSSSSSAGSAASAPASTPAKSGTVKVDIKNFDYSPRMITVKVGTTVKWTNRDEANHTVTFDAGSMQDLGDQPKGSTKSFTFKTAGTFKYHCDYHPNMHGVVVVS